MVYGKTQEADTEMTHKKLETHTRLRAIDKTIKMIHVRVMDNNRFRESEGRNSNIDRFDSSHLALTGDDIAKTQILTAEMHKTHHNHHTKPDDMILILILDDKATIVQPAPKTRYANTAEELITLLENVKFALIA